jgi:hypothetical protein
MADQFIGMTVFLALNDPEQTQVRGLVADVAGQELVLSNGVSTYPHTGIASCVLTSRCKRSSQGLVTASTSSAFTVPSSAIYGSLNRAQALRLGLNSRLRQFKGSILPSMLPRCTHRSIQPRTSHTSNITTIAPLFYSSSIIYPLSSPSPSFRPSCLHRLPWRTPRSCR